MDIVAKVIVKDGRLNFQKGSETMTKPYIERKFYDLGILMRHLRAIQALDYQQCKDIYKVSKKELLKNIYAQISETALK